MSCRPLILVILAVLCFAAAAASPSAQPFPQSSDLDALMTRVLARRDDNWKKLQQYTLNERETVQVTALAVFRVFGFEREYLWFPRAGFFVRSPLEADGVAISEERRREEEERWLARSRDRERESAKKAEKAENNVETSSAETRPAGDLAVIGTVEDVISQSFEPDFIRSANFLRFKVEEGRYALAGRERMLDRDVLRIEYYPTRLFEDDDDDGREVRGGRNRDRADGGDGAQGQKLEQRIEAGMNKVSLVTMWIDPAAAQILRYEFRITDMDFLPGSSLFRISGTRATMQMAQPFPGVWLPESIAMRFRLTSAAGPLEARYDVRYRDYRLPTVSGRVR